MPEALRRLNFIFFDDAARFEASADRLAEALQTDIGWVRQHTEFGEAARRWSAAGRPGGLLLRSPVLEEAERWIASRPRGAPEPTAETQVFVAASRRGTTRRRNILTGSLAAGLVVALALAGLAYWQRGIAVEQRQIADQQRKRAEDTLAAATKTANSLVFDLAERFRDMTGIPASLIKDILDRARALQEQLIKSGQVTPELKGSEADALLETAISLLAIGDTKGALAAAEEARQILADLLAGNPSNTGYQRELSLSYERVGDVQVAQGDLAGAINPIATTSPSCSVLAQSDPGNASGSVVSRSRTRRWATCRRRRATLRGRCNRTATTSPSCERLAQSDPSDAGWQRDLSVSYDKVGDVQVAQGDLAAAMQSYRDSLAIRQRLAQSDPGNAFGSVTCGLVREGRRRAGGAGRPGGGAEILWRQPRHLGAPGAIRPEQRRLAA